MTTSKTQRPVLIIKSKEGKLIGSCGTQCYDDEGFHCTCICGGTNHGVGRKQAARNVLEGIDIDWKATWAKIPKSDCQLIIPRATRTYAEQSELFDIHPPHQEEPEPCRLPTHRF